MPFTNRKTALVEFIILMASMSSLMALSIDAILPALPLIGADLGVVRANDNQLLISSLFVGMAFGLLIFGPLSDSFGRKPPLAAGLGLFVLGCLISIGAHGFEQMLIGRVIQGIGLAAPRVVSLAMIRDLFHGEGMAKVMSFVMMVFILVPALAPALGQAILWIAPWQAIFWMYLVLSMVVLVWFTLRQPETLVPEKRTPFGPINILQQVFQILKTREAMGPTTTIGIVFGAFLGYLSTAQQIFGGMYDRAAQFPLYFGALALVFGGASLLNSRLVQVYKMRPLALTTLAILSACSGGFFLVALNSGGVPPFWAFMLFLAASFMCIAILFGNLNAMAMEPLGKIAGIGAAVVGTFSTLISAGLGVLIGQLYDDTLIPMASGFACLGLASMVILMVTTKTGKDPIDAEISL